MSHTHAHTSAFCYVARPNTTRPPKRPGGYRGPAQEGQNREAVPLECRSRWGWPPTVMGGDVADAHTNICTHDDIFIIIATIIIATTIIVTLLIQSCNTHIPKKLDE